MTHALDLTLCSLVRLPKFTTFEELADFMNEHNIAWVRFEQDGCFTTPEDQLASASDVSSSNTT